MNGNAQNQMTMGQMRELLIRIIAAVPLDISGETAQFWIHNPAVLGRVLSEPLKLQLPDIFKISYQQFYKKFFGIELDVSSIKLPETKEGFDRLLVVAKGLTLNQVYDACSNNFPCWRWTDDLDKAVIHNDREPKETYAIWLRNRQEADEELKNLSADDLKKKNTQCITLLERLILELKFWDGTGKHLDVSNFTLCAGSRASGGPVPRVCWYAGRLEVGWCNPALANPRLRARAAVSCQP